MEQIYFTDKQVGSRYAVKRGSIWRWIKVAGFPKPVKLSEGCTRWRLEDIQKWEARRNPV